MTSVEKKRLGDLVNFKRGYDLPAHSREAGTYPVLSSSGISGYHSKYKAEGEGIVTGRYGTLGKMYYVNEKYWPHNTALYVTSFKGNHPKYIYYLLKCLGRIRTSDKSAVPGVNKNELHEMVIPFVDDKSQQLKIASVLSVLDKKIELNNRTSIELEAMAKTLYDYWFVQFDFPDQNGKPYKSSGGKMVYNETLKREVPEGWEVTPIEHWIGKDKTGDWGKDCQQGNYITKVSCIRGADINGINGTGNAKPPTRYIFKKNEIKILEPYDFIIEISGGSPTQSTGRLAFITNKTIDRFENPIICSNFCKAMSLTNNAYFFNFIYLWNSIYENNILFGWEGKTSGIKNLLFDSFVKNYQVTLPPETLVSDFSEIIRPMQDKKQRLLLENQQLTQLRDWLLPMLMNGQVTVK